MNLFKKPLLLFVASLVLASCAKIYHSPDSKSVAASHNVIAIIPPTVSINAKEYIDPKVLKEQHKQESLNFQKEMHSWMLKRKMQGKLMQEIMDIETVNAKLSQAGYPEKPMNTNEMCAILGVDGIIGSNYSLSKPVTEGAAIALGLVGFNGAATNKIHATVSIQDCTNKKLIWNFSQNYEGPIGSTPLSLVNQVMREASKKMPYLQKK
jgi:hypothetical protein